MLQICACSRQQDFMGVRCKQHNMHSQYEQIKQRYKQHDMNHRYELVKQNGNASGFALRSGAFLEGGKPQPLRRALPHRIRKN